MADSERVAAWLALLSMPGAGAQLARRLAARFGGPEQVLAAPEQELLACRLSGEQAAWLRTARRRLRHAGDQAEAAQEHGISFLLADDPEYPELLAGTPDAPPLLSLLGTLEAADSRAVALVGTRSPSPPGAGTATFLARALALHGVTVVSGLARGVDRAAHQGALAAGGRTLAVLGCGLEQCYPPEHQELAQGVAGQGCLLSERPPWFPPTRQALLARNRLQAGLAKALLVVQAREQGGSYVAARRTLKLGRPLFALSWRDPEFAAGADRLAGMGAVVGKAEDLLAELVAAAYAPAPAPPLVLDEDWDLLG